MELPHMGLIGAICFQSASAIFSSSVLICMRTEFFGQPLNQGTGKDFNTGGNGWLSDFAAFQN